MAGQVIEVGKPFNVKIPKPKKRNIFNPLNAWRLFSQKGLSTGLSSSPQHSGLSILGSTATNPEELKRAFGCCCNPCQEIFTDLYFDINAYHACNLAHFDLYVLDYQKTNTDFSAEYYIWIGHANVNSYKSSLQNSPNNGNAPDINDYDYFIVPESTLAIANSGKTEEQCCDMRFILWPSPWPSRIFLTNEYMLVTEEDFSYNTGARMYIKSINNITLDQRESQSVHSNIAYATIKTPAGTNVNECDFVGRIAQGTVRDGEKTSDGCCVLIGSKNLAPGIEVPVDLCRSCACPAPLKTASIGFFIDGDYTIQNDEVITTINNEVTIIADARTEQLPYSVIGSFGGTYKGPMYHSVLDGSFVSLFSQYWQMQFAIEQTSDQGANITIVCEWVPEPFFSNILNLNNGVFGQQPPSATSLPTVRPRFRISVGYYPCNASKRLPIDADAAITAYAEVWNRNYDGSTDRGRNVGYWDPLLGLTVNGKVVGSPGVAIGIIVPDESAPPLAGGGGPFTLSVPYSFSDQDLAPSTPIYYGQINGSLDIVINNMFYRLRDGSQAPVFHWGFNDVIWQ